MLSTKELSLEINNKETHYHIESEFLGMIEAGYLDLRVKNADFSENFLTIIGITGQCLPYAILVSFANPMIKETLKNEIETRILPEIDKALLGCQDLNLASILKDFLKAYHIHFALTLIIEKEDEQFELMGFIQGNFNVLLLQDKSFNHDNVFNIPVKSNEEVILINIIPESFSLSHYKKEKQSNKNQDLFWDELTTAHAREISLMPEKKLALKRRKILMAVKALELERDMVRDGEQNIKILLQQKTMLDQLDSIKIKSLINIEPLGQEYVAILTIVPNQEQRRLLYSKYTSYLTCLEMIIKDYELLSQELKIKNLYYEQLQEKIKNLKNDENVGAINLNKVISLLEQAFLKEKEWLNSSPYFFSPPSFEDVLKNMTDENGKNLKFITLLLKRTISRCKRVKLSIIHHSDIEASLEKIFNHLKGGKENTLVLCRRSCHF